MSKTSITLFAILIICIGVFIYFNAPTQLPAQLIITQPKATKNATMRAVVSLDKIATYDDTTIKLGIEVDNLAVPLKVVQLEIGYDPNVLQIETITPGQYFTSPITLLKNVNEHIGRISYALTCDDQTNCIHKSKRTLASLTFTRIGQAENNMSIVELLPKTLLKTKNDEGISLQVKNITLTFAETNPVSSTSAEVKKGPLQNR